MEKTVNMPSMAWAASRLTAKEVSCARVAPARSFKWRPASLLIRLAYARRRAVAKKFPEQRRGSLLAMCNAVPPIVTCAPIHGS